MKPRISSARAGSYFGRNGAVVLMSIPLFFGCGVNSPSGTVAHDEATASRNESATPEKPPSSGDLQITGVSIAPDVEDYSFRLSITLGNPWSENVLSKSTIRLLFVSSEAAKEFRTATDVPDDQLYGDGTLQVGSQFRYGYGPIFEDDNEKQIAYVVDLLLIKSEWAESSSSPQTIDLSLTQHRPFSWSRELVAWLLENKKGYFVVGFVNFSEDGKITSLDSTSYKNSFDLERR